MWKTRRSAVAHEHCTRQTRIHRRYEGANVLTYVFSLLEFWTTASRQMPGVFRGGATAAIIPATLTKERSSARDGIAGATRRCSVSLPGERLIVDGGWHESFTRVFVEPKIDQLPISSTHSINLSARRHLRHLGVITISLVNDHVGAASVADYSRVIRRGCDYAINSSARCTSGFAEFAR